MFKRAIALTFVIRREFIFIVLVFDAEDKRASSRVVGNAERSLQPHKVKLFKVESYRTGSLGLCFAESVVH